jgi:hypothetical protein
MSNNTFVLAIAGAAVIGISTGFIVRWMIGQVKIHKLQVELAKLGEQNSALQKQYAEAHEYWTQAVEEARQEACPFTVQVTPIIYQDTNEGFIKDSCVIESGWEYQIFVKGLPWGEPHIKWQNRSVAQAVNHEKVEKMTQLAIKTISAAAQNLPLMQVINKFVRLAEPRVLGNINR